LYTEWYWQIDLHNMLRFLALRMDAHAQYEIRAYAEVMATHVRAVCPIVMDAFDSHIVESVKFSSREMAQIRTALKGVPVDVEDREYERLCQKLGVRVPRKGDAPF
jgi:thymidylate synthase (FAD)